MSRDRQNLQGILAAASLALSYVAGMSRDGSLADTRCQDAVVRRLEIIGEAARRVSPEGRAAHTSLPWREMVGTRNMMIHEYDEVDPAVVWAPVTTHLPPLIEMVERAVAD